MVRLRSNRWYSLDGQGKSRASVATQAAGSRRVISLCLLLALVIVLMQKASDPSHVRDAFSALGVPFDREVAAQVEAVATQSVPTQSAETPVASSPVIPQVDTQMEDVDAKWSSACRDLVPRVLDEATNKQILELSRRWFTRQGPDRSNDDQADEQIEAGASDILLQLGEEVQNRLAVVEDQLGKVSESERIEWEQHLNRFRSEWTKLRSSIENGMLETPVSPSLADVLSDFLDAKLIAQMRDGAPWTKSETVPFLRLIQRTQEQKAEDFVTVDPPLLNTLQLEAEVSVFRGKFVRFRGEVRRVESVTRGTNAFDIRDYWSLWLRGEDGAFQPVAVYTTNSIASVLQQAVAEERFPAVEVLGVVGKRLAYASQEGVEVAPTIFAASIIQFAEDTMPSETEDTNQDLAKDFGWTALIGLLFAGLVLTPILANWRRRTIRSIRGKSSGLLLLTVGLISMSATAQSATAQTGDGTRPPWAQVDNDPIQSLLAERLDAAFNDQGVDEIRDFLNGDMQSCPDAALKTMHVMRQLGWAKMLTIEKDVELASSGLILSPAELRGYVRLAMPVKLDDGQQQWFQRSPDEQIYRIDVEAIPSVDDGAKLQTSKLQTMFCSSIPSQWMASVQLKQPVVIRGLRLLERHNDLETVESLCLFSRGPQWRVTEGVSMLELQPRLTVPQRYLGLLGWDLANFDIVSRHNQQPIQAEESTAFYSLIRVLDGAESPQGEKISVFQALSKPAENVGTHVDWRVRLVNGSAVEVTSEEDRQSLGADRYFQYNGFVDMGNQIVHYKLSSDQQSAGRNEVVDFENEFPVTVVMRGASEFLPLQETQRGEQSWSVGKYARVSGVLYRLWSYRSELMEEKSDTARQAAPLVVALEMNLDTPPIRPAESPIGWFGYALCLTTLLILGGILYAVSQRDTRIRRNPHLP